MAKTKLKANRNAHNQPFFSRLWKNIKKHPGIYVMSLFVIAYYAVFHYATLYGAIIAFKDYSPTSGIMGSDWVGFKHFKNFFSDYYFLRLLKNTVLLSVYNLLWGFPAPIILALLLNEVRNEPFKRSVQTFTYLPHFISLVVVAGMIKEFTDSDGLINDIIAIFDGERTNLLQNAGCFRSIYIISQIWQSVGWGTIIYLAALAGIDQEQYEAAVIDGAGRFQKMLHITLPGLYPTIIILLLLRLGQLMSLGYEKIILLYNSTTLKTADIINSYVYRRGLQQFDWSYSTAVGLFNSTINFVLLVVFNRISKKVSDNSLW